MGSGNVKQTGLVNSTNSINLTRSTKLANSFNSMNKNYITKTIFDSKINLIYITDIIKMTNKWCDINCIFKLKDGEFHFLIKIKNEIVFYDNYNQKSYNGKGLEINANGLTKKHITELNISTKSENDDQHTYFDTPIEIVKINDKLYVGDCMIIKFNFDAIIKSKCVDVELNDFYKMTIVQDYMECLSDQITSYGIFIGTLCRTDIFSEKLVELYKNQNSDNIENMY